MCTQKFIHNLRFNESLQNSCSMLEPSRQTTLNFEVKKMPMKKIFNNAMKSLTTIALLGSFLATPLFAADNQVDDSINFDKSGALENPKHLSSNKESRRDHKSQKNKTNSSPELISYTKASSSMTLSKLVDRKKQFYTTFSTGVGFIKIRKATGLLNAKPSAGAFDLGANLKVNRVRNNNPPCFEVGMGYNILDWLSVELTTPFQNAINVSSSAVSSAFVTNAQFFADLSVQGLLAKGVLQAPWTLLWNRTKLNLQAKGGLGLSWQSWTNIRNSQSHLDDNGQQVSFVSRINSKTFANVLGEIGGGIGFTRLNKNGTPSNLNAGIEAVVLFWGNIRNIGLATQAGSQRYALSDPFKAKGLISTNLRFNLSLDF